MAALWILLGILALPAALLSLSATLYVEIREQVRIRAGILWLRFPILPQPEKTAEEEKPPSEKKRKKAELKKKADELEEKPVGGKTLGDTVEFVLLLVKSILPGLGDLLSHLRFTQMRIALSVGTDSADQTAVAYGAAAAGVYNLLAVIDKGCVLRLKSVDIAPDFVSGETVYDISFKVKLRLARVVWDALRMGLTVIINLIKRPGDVPQGKTKQKRSQSV